MGRLPCSSTIFCWLCPCFGRSGVAVAVAAVLLIGAMACALFSSFAAVSQTVSAMSVTPNSGLPAGGNIVQINGSGLTGASSVTFGGTPVNGFAVVDDTSIAVNVPVHVAGTVDVVVTVAGKPIVTAYTYMGAKTVTSIAPAGGQPAGGNIVQITGSDLLGATAVSFGGVAANGFVVINDRVIAANAPAHAAGVVDIVITTPRGTSTDTGAYTYGSAAPAIASVAPSTGAALGGTMVTITGKNFIGATSVKLGGSPASAITVVNDTTITAATPAHAAGIADVSVVTSSGTGTAPGAYTYAAPSPAITSIAPATGSTKGGTAVTITGTNLSGAVAVTIGSGDATDIVVVNSTTITAKAPAHAAGAADVSVITPAGIGGRAVFAYASPAPSIVSVDPQNGVSRGGTPVNITGSNFSGTLAVMIGDELASDIVVVNDTTIRATTAPHPAGVADVAVTTQAGTGTSLGAYSFAVPEPAIANIAPAKGPALGGTEIAITGTNLTGAIGVVIGGVPASGIVVVSDTSITAITPAHATGMADIAVTTAGGTATAAGAYSYAAAAPEIASVAPPNGPTSGGTALTITGKHLTGAIAVAVGGIDATDVVVVNDTTITATSPARTAGRADVSITTSAGTGSGVGAYVYATPAPTIARVSPAVGSTLGGTPVTITGTNLTGAIAVTIGDTAVTEIVVVNDKTITATTHSHAVASANVVVTTPRGTGVGTGLFAFIPTLALGWTKGGATRDIQTSSLPGGARDRGWRAIVSVAKPNAKTGTCSSAGAEAR